MKQILIIEDSDTDAYLFKEAIKDCNVQGIGITIAPTWARAEPMVSDPSISLIMLDLNLSEGMKGLDVIRLVKEEKRLRVPILIFSTSSSPSDIRACYEAGANGYIIKPYDVEELFLIICSTFKWWLEVNKL